MTEEKGIVENMFDFSFSEFITPKIIMILFIIGIIIAAVATVMVVVGGFAKGMLVGLLTLVVSPIIFGLEVLAARIWCELVMVMFRIAENTGQTACSLAKEPAQE